VKEIGQKSKRAKTKSVLQYTKRIPISKDRLTTALSTLKKDEEGGYYNTSHFLNLSIKASHSSFIDKQVLPSISAFMQYILNDLQIIETIINRMAWQNDLRTSNQLDEWKWMSFSECDINLFNIHIRSIFDYAAKIIQRSADNPKSCDMNSFNELKNWLVKNPENNSKTLGQELAKLILSVDWFEGIKTLRDEVMHRGGKVIVMSDNNKLLFQVMKSRYAYLISTPELMFNENLAYFESYAGLYFGYLIAFLKELAINIENRLPKGTHSSGLGDPKRIFGKEKPTIIYNWIEELSDKKSN
jgi:hypothetical protein